MQYRVLEAGVAPSEHPQGTPPAPLPRPQLKVRAISSSLRPPSSCSQENTGGMLHREASESRGKRVHKLFTSLPKCKRSFLQRDAAFPGLSAHAVPEASVCFQLTQVDCQLLGQHPRDVLQQPAACDVSVGFDSAATKDRQQQTAVDLCRRQQNLAWKRS